MLCKYCGGKTIVIDGAKNHEQEEIYRCRVCIDCGMMFYTVEFPVEVDEQFRKAWVSNHRKHFKVRGDTYYSPEGVKRLRKYGYGRKKKHKKETK